MNEIDSNDKLNNLINKGKFNKFLIFDIKLYLFLFTIKNSITSVFV
jgi:hypothetical protein